MNTKQFFPLTIALFLCQPSFVFAMDTQSRMTIREAFGVPLTKETVLAGVVGPILTEPVRTEAERCIRPDAAGLQEAMYLPETLTKADVTDRRKKLEQMLSSKKFEVNKQWYGVFAADPANKLYTLWHRDLPDVNIWKPENRTDENYGKIKVTDSGQTISVRACCLALLAARDALKPDDQSLVKVLPAYILSLSEDSTASSDASCVIIHKLAPQSVVLAKAPELIPSIPEKALRALFSMIMDEKSGAAGALWDNGTIAVEKDEQGRFKRWIIGLCQKPNNQRPEIFFNQDPNFHANCQYEGLKTLAQVLDRSEDKTLLHQLCQLIVEHKQQLDDDKGRDSRWHRIAAEILSLVEKKEQKK